MITKGREEELEAIACEIFDALSCERYEPSERGAGWAPTDKGYRDVIHILSRAKAMLWGKDSPAERRKAALYKRKQQQKEAEKLAKRLMGKDTTVHSFCIHCNKPIYRELGGIGWLTWDESIVCPVRRSNNSKLLDHEATERAK